MWRIIDRYIFREVFTPFSLTLSALMIILLTEQTARLVELFINKGVSLWAGAKVFLYLLPSFLVMGIPLSVLIATIIAFSRLTADTEITALRACGLSLFRIARPVLVFSTMTFMLTFSLSVWAQPMVGRSLKSAAMDLIRQEFTLGLEPGLFNEPFDRMMIYVDTIPAPNRLEGVVIYDFRNANRRALILARDGTILNDPGSDTIGFRLTEGSEHSEEAVSGRYQWITFGTYEFKVNLGAAIRRDASEEGFSAEIADLQRRFASAEKLNRQDLRRLGEYYKNFAFPFSCFI
ncbi:MAG TPA: LptF/LptG family permease, partial [Nitrospiria bacterium]